MLSMLLLHFAVLYFRFQRFIFRRYFFDVLLILCIVFIEFVQNAPLTWVLVLAIWLVIETLLMLHGTVGSVYYTYMTSHDLYANARPNRILCYFTVNDVASGRICTRKKWILSFFACYEEVFCCDDLISAN